MPPFQGFYSVTNYEGIIQFRGKRGLPPGKRGPREKPLVSTQKPTLAFAHRIQNIHVIILSMK